MVDVFENEKGKACIGFTLQDVHDLMQDITELAQKHSKGKIENFNHILSMVSAAAEVMQVLVYRKVNNEPGEVAIMASREQQKQGVAQILKFFEDVING